MRTLISILFLKFICSTLCVGQKAVLRDVVEVTFNTTSVHEKIFFHNNGIGQRPFVHPKGDYAFIVMPNAAVLKYYPNISDDFLLGQENHWIGGFPFIEKNGEIIAISSINAIQADSNIEQFIIFDKISISKKKAQLVFHSTTIRQRVPSAEKYFQFEYSLKKNKTTWVITKSKVAEIPCCDFRFDGR